MAVYAVDPKLVFDISALTSHVTPDFKPKPKPTPLVWQRAGVHSAPVQCVASLPDARVLSYSKPSGSAVGQVQMHDGLVQTRMTALPLADVARLELL
jgi:hypothetical protein